MLASCDLPLTFPYHKGLTITRPAYSQQLTKDLKHLGSIIRCVGIRDASVTGVGAPNIILEPLVRSIGIWDTVLVWPVDFILEPFVRSIGIWDTVPVWSIDVVLEPLVGSIGIWNTVLIWPVDVVLEPLVGSIGIWDTVPVWSVDVILEPFV